MRTSNYPSNYQMVDKGIIDVVLLLVSNGFKTIGSCEGGKGHPITSCRTYNPDHIGPKFITVDARCDKSNLINILKCNNYYFKLRHITSLNKSQKLLFPNGWYFIKFISSSPEN